MVLEKLNDEQMEILLDFADRCRYLCFGQPPKGRDADNIAYKQWKELSRDLNYAGDLPWKSGKEWKMYWTELKNRTKAKLANAKRRSKFTGEALNLQNFNCWEERIIELADMVAKEPKTKHVFSENGDADTTDSIPNEMVCEPKFESTPNTSQNGLNTDNSQVTPLDMSNTYTTQLQPEPQYVSIGTQMIATPGIKKSMPAPINSPPPIPQTVPFQYMVMGSPPGISMLPPMYNQTSATNNMATAPNNTSGYTTAPQAPPAPARGPGGPPPPPARDPSIDGLSQLSVAVHALADASMAVADANMAIANALKALGSKVSNSK